jgi:galactose-1-phosphate uridylyltransferase
LTCDINTINNLKDINIIVRDTSTYEKYPNGIFGENGPYHLVPETDVVPEPEPEPQGE